MTTIQDLTWRIEYLRNEQDSLLDGNGKLLAYGITSHVYDVCSRLLAIRAEARNISKELDRLGRHDLADDAAEGWALVIPPPGYKTGDTTTSARALSDVESHVLGPPVARKLDVLHNDSETTL